MVSTDNAAGPDGFSSLFYQACWEIIKGDLTEAVMDFFHGFSQPKGVDTKKIGGCTLERLTSYKSLQCQLQASFKDLVN